MDNNNTESNYDVILAHEVTSLCHQVENIAMKCDITQLLEGHKASPLHDDFYKQVTELKACLDNALDTVKRVNEIRNSPQMILQKQGEGIPMREQPGRRKKTSGDSGVGSSAFGSSIGSRCPTISRGSAMVVPSTPIGSIPEDKQEMLNRFINADSKPSDDGIFIAELEKDVLSAETQTENDLSKPTAAENTESSESDNEKQPIYSSDESRFSSIKSYNCVQTTSAASQTVLCALDPCMTNFSHVTEKFYLCEQPDE